MPSSRSSLQAGFSLLEMAIVLIIGGILLKYGLQATAAYTDNEYRNITRDRLLAIEEALALYVSRNKRLPCPADGTLAQGATNEGLEQLQTAGNYAVCKSGTQFSVVPWRELGLSGEVAVDGWRRRITYRPYDDTTPTYSTAMAGGGNAGGGATRASGMDMTECRAAGTNTATTTDNCQAASPYHTVNAFLKDKGITVHNGDFTNGRTRDPNKPESGGGAALVLISHGKDGAGAYLPNGALLPAPAAAQTLQLENSSKEDGRFVEARYNENPNPPAKYFDDIIRAPTMQYIATKANLGPQ